MHFAIDEQIGNFRPLTRVAKCNSIPTKMFTEGHQKWIITDVAAVRSPKPSNGFFASGTESSDYAKEKFKPDHFNKDKVRSVVTSFIQRGWDLQHFYSCHLMH